MVALLSALSGCSRLVVLNDPLTAVEHNDLGVAYERGGDHELAGRQYRRALRIDSRLALARVNLGNLAAARGHWEAAERCYRRALLDQPGHIDARNNLAFVLLKRGGSLDEAEWLARSAVALAGERDSIPRATLVEVLAARRGR